MKVLSAAKKETRIEFYNSDLTDKFGIRIPKDFEVVRFETVQLAKKLQEYIGKAKCILLVPDNPNYPMVDFLLLKHSEDDTGTIHLVQATLNVRLCRKLDDQLGKEVN